MKLLLAVAASSVALAAVAAPQQGTPKKPAAPVKTAKVVDVCPVNHEKVTDLKTAEHSTYNGVTYYFCCAGCKPAFDKNPAKYVKVEKPAAKPGQPAVKS